MTKKMKKSQVSLETAVAFLMILGLFFGIMGMWAWADRQMAKRQPEFNDSQAHGRVESGKPKRKPGDNNGDKYLHWEPGTIDWATGKPKNDVYEAEELKQSEVHH